ncbi:MAG: carboxypeptidase-like regulatory domain-containing protein, partial [Sphingobacterium sp.]|nr:carboxypeptidase-like regulatory domain-containing protein [Sphingobacterium sp.]
MIKQPKLKTGRTAVAPKTLRGSLLVSGALLLFGNPLLAAPVFSSDLIMNVRLSFQENEIQGTVKDSATKVALAGVTIKVVGKSAATSTNDQGVFRIKAAPNDVIEISYIGYETTRRTIPSGTSNLQIALVPDASSLEEVVVTGYGTQRKKDLTGSVAIVDVAQLKAQPAATAVEALQGKAAGVQIVNDGAPGSTPQIKIRGY